MAAPFLVPPAAGGTIGESLQRRGISRRALLKYASYLGALMALPASATQAFAEGLANGASAIGHLAVVPGMHRLHQVSDPRVFADV